MQQALGVVAASLETDASTCGTAVHAGIEHVMRRWLDTGLSPFLIVGLYEDALDVVDTELDTLEPGVTWVKYTPDHWRWLARQAFHHWWGWALPRLIADGHVPLAVEAPFDVPVDSYDVRGVEGGSVRLNVRLRGTIDTVTERPYDGTSVVQGVDWKTASRPWRRADKERSNVQAPIYHFALGDIYGSERVADRFLFMVMPHDSPKHRTQRIWVTTPDDKVAWVLGEACKVAELVVRLGLEGAASLAPKNDSTMLCSDTWCPLHATCKAYRYH